MFSFSFPVNQSNEGIPTSPSITLVTFTTETMLTDSTTTETLASSSNSSSSQSMFTGVRTDDTIFYVPVTDIWTQSGISNSTESAFRRIDYDSDGI